ncbi:ABC transporter ATP-binding protein [Clostridium drakei]|uniref:Peptide ABC transporter ATP-binding protein n=1 Tax=Clostridium drakei TaxID=332101 RepID=A0A2U8DRR6_9CLOT|nr:ABC transporter ATP-binding protein [Clostridium drakei]AWI05457.1 peptide ABC transporter ATP-binding protein [Clostridium drakei]
MNKIIELNNVQKYYKLGLNKLHVLKNINFSIEQGDFLIIMGKSGSGKTTLMNILGFLDDFDEGEYIFSKQNVTKLNENQRSEFRNNYMGFIFQQFHLIESLTVGQNIELPLLYQNKLSKKQRHELVKDQLELVGLSNKINQKPSFLSGGQQQRIAISRALVNNPSIIFADEPTGALDSGTSRDIMNILEKLNNEGRTIVMVTHDLDLRPYGNKIISIQDGFLVQEV